MALDPQLAQLFGASGAPPASPDAAAVKATPPAAPAPSGLDPQIAQLFANAAAAQPSNGASPSRAASAPQDLTDRLANLAGRHAGPIGQQLVRQTGLIGRTLAETGNHLANAVPDAANSLYQLATNPAARAATLQQLKHPSQYFTMPANAPSSIVSNALGQVLPTAQSGPERFASGVESFLAGTPTGLGAAGRIGGIGNAIRAALPGANVPARFIAGVSSNPELAGAQAARSAAPSGLTAAQQQAAAGGRALGMQLTPGRASGFIPLQQLEARLESKPWTSGPFARLASGNQRVLNRTVAQSIGESADHVDADVLSRANDRLGDVFQNVRSTNRTVMADPKATSSALDAIDGEYEGLLPGDASIRANPLVQRLETLMQRGHINGQQLGALSSKLGKAAFKQLRPGGNGDADLGRALYDVKDHVDDLVQSTLSPAEAAAYAAARGQYRNLMTILSRTNIVNPSTGNVSGTALASKLQQADRRGFLYGRNQTPMYQAARFAQAFKPIVGDSGTATRSGAHGIFGPLALGLAGHFSGLPLGEDLALAAAPIAGRIAGNLASRAYLTRPGAALVRGALATPGATLRGMRALAMNPMLWAPQTIPGVTRIGP